MPLRRSEDVVHHRNTATSSHRRARRRGLFPIGRSICRRQPVGRPSARDSAPKSDSWLLQPLAGKPFVPPIAAALSGARASTR